ncbi:glycoside hydrolase family 16 protein [Salinibacterium sp. NK8237]|uniref:glycoside hydrolase family 16 protein n=1 Tax=Salinibacterium sp. NK8237 TaxID=2792038 RepID=UPI0018CC9053|nr:glycoside hydrolase family 16 protein [Salinibacterium sp. NK8237]MBH0130350.1 ricin-type beta-trefoil lectin domain protein [Salinibacterium sp. NK8237]
MTTTTKTGEVQLARNNRRSRLATYGLVAAVACTALVGAAPASASAPAPASGWDVVFLDDFTSPAGSGLNTDDWLYDIGHGYPGGANNWGTGEIAYMTDSTENVYQDGEGNLAIKPIRDAAGNWTSGRIETQRTDFEPPADGVLRVEASIMQPSVSGAQAQGYWPAFWMLGEGARGTAAHGWPGIGEIDILEAVNGSESSHGALHCGTLPGGPCNEPGGLASGTYNLPGATSGFHTYAMEWDRSGDVEEIRWYADGENYFTINENAVDATTWANATDHGYFVILNVAMGGVWPGSPTAATTSGAPMLVDYVGVYSRSGSAGGDGGTGGDSAEGTITGIGGKCVDVAGSNTNNGTQVQLYTCNGTDAQSWDIRSDGTVRAFDKCLDVEAANTTNGTRVQLFECNGTAAQQWYLNSASGDIVSALSGTCLDARGVSSANRTPLQIWECGGGVNQKWNW